jgi:hypothetical protein
VSDSRVVLGGGRESEEGAERTEERSWDRSSWRVEVIRAIRWRKGTRSTMGPGLGKKRCLRDPGTEQRAGRLPSRRGRACDCTLPLSVPTVSQESPPFC